VQILPTYELEQFSRHPDLPLDVQARGLAPEPPPPAPVAAPAAPGGEAITDQASISGGLPGGPPDLAPDEGTMGGTVMDEAGAVSPGAGVMEVPRQADEAIESAEATREPTADNPGGKPGHDSSTLRQRSLWADDDGPTEGAALDAASPPASGSGASRADVAGANARDDEPGGGDDTAEEPDPGVRQ
jgi:hypothetical protein